MRMNAMRSKQSNAVVVQMARRKMVYHYIAYNTVHYCKNNTQLI